MRGRRIVLHDNDPRPTPSFATAPGVRLGMEPESNQENIRCGDQRRGAHRVRAKGNNEAYDIVNEKNGDLQRGLNGFNGVVTPHGGPLGMGNGNQAKAGTDDEHETGATR